LSKNRKERLRLILNDPERLNRTQAQWIRTPSGSLLFHLANFKRLRAFFFLHSFTFLPKTKPYRTTSEINPEREKKMGILRHEKDMTTFWIKAPAGNTVQIESLRTR
jgi:hypothetical protein